VNLKWIGVTMVLAGCGSVGFSMAASYRQRERQFESLCRGIDFMVNSLQYRLTPLPELCGSAGIYIKGAIGAVLTQLSTELDKQISPNAACCMDMVLKRSRIPADVRRVLEQMGEELGRFDLTGQIQGLERVKQICRCELELLRDGRDTRLRSYQTLGLCAGAALAILLI